MISSHTAQPSLGSDNETFRLQKKFSHWAAGQGGSFGVTDILGKEFKCIFFGKNWNYLKLTHGNSQNHWEKTLSIWKGSSQDTEENQNSHTHKTPFRRKAEFRLQKLSARSSLVRKTWLLEGKTNTAWLFFCWVWIPYFLVMVYLKRFNWQPEPQMLTLSFKVRCLRMGPGSHSNFIRTAMPIQHMRHAVWAHVLLNMVSKSHTDPASFPACKSWWRHPFVSKTVTWQGNTYIKWLCTRAVVGTWIQSHAGTDADL